MENSTSWDEAALIGAAARGNLDAFNELVLHYQTQAYNLAYAMLSDPAAAEDATQEAFISAYRSLKTFRGTSLRPWLMQIVANACRDELRRQKRRPAVSWDEFGDLDEEANPHLSDESATPEETMQQEELRRFINACLLELPQDQRLVVVLVDRLGYPYEEAAQILHVPVGTVKSRLARARIRLQRLLQTKAELLPRRYRQNNTNDREAVA